MGNSEKKEMFCGYSIKSICEKGPGGLDEIYCYTSVKDLLAFMVALFELKYKPNWIRVEKSYLKKGEYDVRVCFCIRDGCTMWLNFDECKKFKEKFIENIENSYVSKYNCEFQLFYMDNDGGPLPEDTVVVRDSNLAVMSSVGKCPIFFDYSLDQVKLECNIDSTDYITVIANIMRQE